MKYIAGASIILGAGYLCAFQHWSLWTLFFGVFIGMGIANDDSILNIKFRD